MKNGHIRNCGIVDGCYTLLYCFSQKDWPLNHPPKISAQQDETGYTGYIKRRRLRRCGWGSEVVKSLVWNFDKLYVDPSISVVKTDLGCYSFTSLKMI